MATGLTMRRGVWGWSRQDCPNPGTPEALPDAVRLAWPNGLKVLQVILQRGFSYCFRPRCSVGNTTLGLSVIDLGRWIMEWH